jgi:hypothetical protein
LPILDEVGQEAYLPLMEEAAAHAVTSILLAWVETRCGPGLRAENSLIEDSIMALDHPLALTSKKAALR